MSIVGSKNYYRAETTMGENNKKRKLDYLELPALIAFQEEKVIRAREAVNLKKLENSVKRARKILQSAALKNLNYQQQLARVTISMESSEAELIALETDLKLAEIEFNRLSNTFLAERKQVSYKIAEMSHLE